MRYEAFYYVLVSQMMTNEGMNYIHGINILQLKPKVGKDCVLQRKCFLSDLYKYLHLKNGKPKESRPPIVIACLGGIWN